MLLLDNSLKTNNGRTVLVKGASDLPKKGTVSCIVLPPNYTLETLSHEIGHAKSMKTPLLRQVQDFSGRAAKRLKENGEVSDLFVRPDRPSLQKSGILRAVRNFRDSKAVKLEENIANKNSFRIMRKLNIPKEDIKRIKAQYKGDTKSAYGVNDIAWKSNLRNTVAIKRYDKYGQVPTNYRDDINRLRRERRKK